MNTVPTPPDGGWLSRPQAAEIMRLAMASISAAVATAQTFREIGYASTVEQWRAAQAADRAAFEALAGHVYGLSR